MLCSLMKGSPKSAGQYLPASMLPDLKLPFAPYTKSSPALTTQQMSSVTCLFLLILV